MTSRCPSRAACLGMLMKADPDLCLSVLVLGHALSTGVMPYHPGALSTFSSYLFAFSESTADRPWCGATTFSSVRFDPPVREYG